MNPDGVRAPALPLPAGRELRPALACLCVTELTSWGALYYSLPVALPELARATGWPAVTIMTAFSGGLLISAVAGAPVGRWLDRRGPRRVMATGSALGTAALLAVAAAPNLPCFVLAWLLAGAAQAMLLYPPAFAAITRWYGPDRIRALTVLSLAGGLASTVYAPLTAQLVTQLGWRQTYLVLAALLSAITLPLHLLCLTPPWAAAGTVPTPSGRRIREVAQTRAFVLLAVTMGLAGLGLYAATTNLVPLLVSHGISTTTAAMALSLCGAGQILGRLGYPALTRKSSPRVRTTAVLAVGACCIAALAVISGPLPLLIAAVVAAGAIRGTYTLLQATAVSDRWGTDDFATLNALATAPGAVATALAPAAGTLLAVQLGGYRAAFGALAVIALTGAALATATAVT